MKMEVNLNSLWNLVQCIFTILEHVHQVIMMMLHSAELDMAKTVTPSDTDTFLTNVSWAICSTHHTVLKASPGARIGLIGLICICTRCYLRMTKMVVFTDKLILLRNLFLGTTGVICDAQSFFPMWSQHKFKGTKKWPSFSISFIKSQFTWNGWCYKWDILFCGHNYPLVCKACAEILNSVFWKKEEEVFVSMFGISIDGQPQKIGCM